MSDKSEFAISREFIFPHKNFQIYSKQRIHIMQRLYEESKPAVHKVLFADDLMVNAKSWRELLLKLKPRSLGCRRKPYVQTRVTQRTWHLLEI